MSDVNELSRTFLELSGHTIQWFLEVFKYRGIGFVQSMLADVSATRLSARSYTIVPLVGYRNAQRHAPNRNGPCSSIRL